jgi:hypothetical protein
VASDKNISEFYQRAISGAQWIYGVYFYFEYKTFS